MKRPLLAAAAALLVLVNAYVLAGVARNRIGEPDAALSLTERELPVAWSSPWGENSGVSLRVETSHWRPGIPPSWRPTSEGWLTGKKLEALGFDVALPRDLDDARHFARRQLSRRGYAVLQFGGSAWELWQRTVADDLARVERGVAAGEHPAASLAAERRLADGKLRTESRLFVVDAGPDAAALRAVHPDRAGFLVVPAQISVFVELDEKTFACVPERCRLAGSVSLLIDEIAVPRRFHSALPAASLPGNRGRSVDAPDGKPRYEVLLRSGARHEPWIEAVRHIAAQP